MLINCPHCQHKLEVVQSGDSQSVPCPSCGSHLYVLTDTLTMKPPKARTIAHFELIESVGQGHYGAVWKARDTNLNRIVAVKIPHALEFTPGMTRMYMHEAQSAARLKHQHIVGVYDVKLEDDRVFIVSEFIDGVSMAEYLTEHQLTPREAAEMCATVADALQYAHEQKIVHRDLKPGNILLDRDRQPHIADFGLAKQMGETITITVQGHVLGTPAYMSPEQARGEGHLADARSDVYSLGVILYEMLAGQRPFKGGSKLLIFQVLNDDPRPPGRLNSKTPRDLETICMKAMHKDPQRRYQSAADMSADLRRYLGGMPILARRASPVERAWRWTRRNRLVASLLSLAAVLAVSLGSVLAYDFSNLPARYRVVVATEPPGATVAFTRLDPQTGKLLESETVKNAGSPAEFKLAPGDYFVVACMSNDPELFHEVYRHVPQPEEETPSHFYHQRWRRAANGVITLSPVHLHRTGDVISGMTKFAGSPAFEMGDSKTPQAPPHLRDVPPFYLDAHEVELKKYRDRRLSIDPRERASPDEFPKTWLLLDDAIAYAESVGKCVMDEGQYEFAATNGGKTKFPWGDDASQMVDWTLGAVGQPEFDRTQSDPPVWGLYSGVLELTSSNCSFMPPLGAAGLSGHASATIAVRGGPADALQATGKERWQLGPRQRFGAQRHNASASVGFRCARSVRPRVIEQ